jgi:hypothetical protein
VTGRVLRRSATKKPPVSESCGSTRMQRASAAAVAEPAARHGEMMSCFTLPSGKAVGGSRVASQTGVSTLRRREHGGLQPPPGEARAPLRRGLIGLALGDVVEARVHHPVLSKSPNGQIAQRSNAKLVNLAASGGPRARAATRGGARRRAAPRARVTHSGPKPGSCLGRSSAQGLGACGSARPRPRRKARARRRPGRGGEGVGFLQVFFSGTQSFSSPG